MIHFDFESIEANKFPRYQKWFSYNFLGSLFGQNFILHISNHPPTLSLHIFACYALQSIDLIIWLRARRTHIDLCVGIDRFSFVLTTTILMVRRLKERTEDIFNRCPKINRCLPRAHWDRSDKVFFFSCLFFLHRIRIHTQHTLAL